ncbi:hypothetical protein P171DRAFT_434601 [Karstenula rhodostoma CBS 690.94]|uniref:HAD-like protein n=1 Tax=Karstenula rhodostoma CBS 690.94 TaxID=1392251 RepID=A0A9P4PBH0_9PLEO|nr:hypothetical protein P171DRAFT_434601 [Karstenula rhodostoma CBS 690.94]
MAEKKRPVMLVLDWDGTLTKKDTLHLVSAIGYERNRGANLRPWDNIVQVYISDFTKHKRRYAPAAELRKAGKRAVKMETKWLDSLKGVETRSIDRVQKAGIFKGVTNQDVHSAATSAFQDEKMQLRPGWRKLLMHQRGSAVEPLVSILSVNWSATFIRACIEAALSGSPASDATIMNSIPVYANELPLVEGLLDSCICTSTDKLAKFKEVRGRKGSNFVVYVGDSATDFNCLNAADVGICVRDDPMGSSQQELKETLDRLGFETLRLSSEAFKRVPSFVDDRANGGGKRKRVIWWVEDLDEISKFVEDIDPRHGLIQCDLDYEA